MFDCRFGVLEAVNGSDVLLDAGGRPSDNVFIELNVSRPAGLGPGVAAEPIRVGYAAVLWGSYEGGGRVVTPVPTIGGIGWLLAVIAWVKADIFGGGLNCSDSSTSPSVLTHCFLLESQTI